MMGTLALVIALILLIIGLGLQVYHTERYLIGDRPFDYDDARTITEAIVYADGAGSIVAVVGLIFVILGLTASAPLANPPALVHRVRQSPAIWALVFSAIFFAVNLATFFILADLEMDVDFDTSFRLYYYTDNLARVFAVAALAIFAFGLWKAEQVQP